MLQEKENEALSIVLIKTTHFRFNMNWSLLAFR